MSNRSEKSRGDSRMRHNRRVWMLETFGNGVTCECVRCGCELDMITMTVDRHPKPGCCGGRYTRDNVRPACADCNVKMGLIHWRQKHSKKYREQQIREKKEKNLTYHPFVEYYQHGRQTDL